jgi:hypothetical protein
MKPPKGNVLANVELQAERGLVQMLEKKYQEAVTESDAADLRSQKAQFECDMAKKEKQDLADRNAQLQFDLNQSNQKAAVLETAM